MLFQAPLINELEAEVLEMIEGTRHRIRHLLHEPRRWHGLLRRTVAARNIRASTAIEGHRVSRHDAAAAVDQAEPFDADGVDWKAVRGYRDAMDYICRAAEDPHMKYSTGLLKSIHYMIMKHDPTSRPGLYRPGAAFVSGEDGPLYEGPAPEAVPGLVEELIEDLNDPNPGPVLVRAGMAHLNLVMIHPFKDGNGRMSRALHTLVIGSAPQSSRSTCAWSASRALYTLVHGSDGPLDPQFSSIEEYLDPWSNRARLTPRLDPLDPRFSSIEEYLGYATPAYYRVLAEVGGRTWDPWRRNSRPWVRFVLRAHHIQARLMTWRVERADCIWERISGLADEAGLNERNMGSLFNAAMGFRVRKHDHIDYAEVSERTATSDLRRMADLGLLAAVGERRGRYYTASYRLRSLVPAGRPAISDPFAI